MGSLVPSRGSRNRCIPLPYGSPLRVSGRTVNDPYRTLRVLFRRHFRRRVFHHLDSGLYRRLASCHLVRLDIEKRTPVFLSPARGFVFWAVNGWHSIGTTLSRNGGTQPGSDRASLRRAPLPSGPVRAYSKYPTTSTITWVLPSDPFRIPSVPSAPSGTTALFALTCPGRKLIVEARGTIAASPGKRVR